MSRRAAPHRGIDVHYGQAEDADAGEPERPSKTQLKQKSHDLQTLGEAVAALSDERLAAVEISDALRHAIEVWRKTKSFEGKRRQMQYIGKLMRKVDPAVLDTMRAALVEQNSGSAQENLVLHLTETWRDRLLASEDAFGEWITRCPDTDTQQLRALIRQARKDAVPEKPGAAVRHGRAYRDIFQLVREHLTNEADTGATP